MFDQINCETIVPKDLRTGKYANAFRIVPDGSSEYLLDFVLYSKHENLARVVSRIRVNESVLIMLREKLSSTMIELETKKGQSVRRVIPNRKEPDLVAYKAPPNKERQ